MPPRKETSSAKSDGKTLHSSTQAVFNLGENGHKREFIGIKIKATDTPDGRKLSIEKTTSKAKGKSTESATSNQSVTERRDNNMNNPRRSGRQRRPAWKTVEMEKSETLKCNLKFQKVKSESDLTQQKKSQSIAYSKRINLASISQILPPKGGDATQKKLKEPHETKYPCSTFPKPDYSQHVRQPKKKTKFKCSSTCLKRSPGGVKERAKRYFSRKRKRRSIELLGKYRKKKLRSNQTNDLWEGFPFNLQMPRNKTEQEALQGGSQVFQSSLQVTNEKTLSEIVTQEGNPTESVQDEEHGKDRNAENGHAESSNSVNNLTFTITTGKKRKKRHRKRKKSSPKSEQRMENCLATVSETDRYGSKTYTTPTDSCTEADVYYPAVDFEATSNKPQHNCKTVPKYSRKFSGPSQYQEDPSTSSGYNINDTKGKKGDTKANSRAESMSSQTVTGQYRKTKQKGRKKVKSPSVDTIAATAVKEKEACVTVPSIKLTVTKADTAEGVDKESNDDHKYRVVLNEVNSHKQNDVTANKICKHHREKGSAEDEHIINNSEDRIVVERIKTLQETSPQEFKSSNEEREASQVGKGSDDGYYQLLLDPNNRRPTQNLTKIKLESSCSPAPTVGESESHQSNTKIHDHGASLEESDILSVANCKLDTSTDAANPIVVAAQPDETIDEHSLYEDASVSKDENKAALKSDDSLFCPEDEQADDENDCEKVEIKLKQKKKSTKTKSTLKVKLPFPIFPIQGNKGEKALKEVSSDEESVVMAPSNSGSSNTQGEIQPLPSPNLQQVIKTTPKKTKCQKLSNDPKSKSTNAPLMQKSRKECTDWRLLSPSSKHRNVRRVSSEGKIPNNPVPSPHQSSACERHKRTTSNDRRKCASSTSETRQGGLPVRSRPLTRRQSLESNTESLLEGLLLVNPEKQVPAAHSHLFDDKRLGIHACSLWSSGNRRHYQLKNPDSSGEELDRLMRDAWEKLSQKEKLQYYKRASNATTDQKKSTSTTTTHKKAKLPKPKPMQPELQRPTSKPVKPFQDCFYSLPAFQQEDILLHKLKYFQNTLSAYHYNRFLYEFTTSFKRSVRNFRNRKAEWLADPVERGVQFASVSRRMLYNKMKQYEGIVAEILQHRQYLSYRHHKLKYDDILWKLITGGPVQFDDTAHSDRLTLLLEAIEDVEQNMNRNPTQIPHQDHGRGEPNQTCTCLCVSEGERRAVQEIAEDLKHSCSTSGSTRVRLNNTDIIIPRVAMGSRLNQQLLSELDHTAPLRELGAEDVDEYLDSLDTIVPDIGHDLVLELAIPLSRVSTPMDRISGISTPLDGLPRISTPLDGLPRVSTSLDGMSKVSTPLDRIPGISTPLDGLPSVSTPQDEVSRVSTPLDGVPRVSTSLDGMSKVSTPLDRIPRISTPLDGLPRVSTPLDGMPSLSTPLDGVPRVSTPLDGLPRVSTSQDGVPGISTPLDVMSELVPSPLEEAWGATYRCLHGLEQCCPLESPSCILSSLLVDHIMAAPP